MAQDDMGILTAGQDMGCLHVSLSTLQHQLQATLDKVRGEIFSRKWFQRKSPLDAPMAPAQRIWTRHNRGLA